MFESRRGGISSKGEIEEITKKKRNRRYRSVCAGKLSPK